MRILEVVTEDVVLKLERGLKKLPSHSYDSIDKLMQKICKDADISGQKLHDMFVDKHNLTPDNWIKKQVDESAAWQKSSGKNKNGGLNKKGVASYRREHPGSHLQTAVTTKPSKLKKGSKAAKRRASFCARMKGMKKHRTGAKTAHDPNSRINKSLRKWHCESIEEMRELIMLGENYISNLKQQLSEGKATHNFDIEDIKRLEKIRDLATLKTQAFELISKPSAKPMKPEKVAWFRGALEKMDSPMKVIKLMYDLYLSGQGHAVIGSRNSMASNNYRAKFGEQGVAEGRRDSRDAYQRDYDRSISGMDAGPLGYGKEWDEEPPPASYKVYVSDGTTWHRSGGIFDSRMQAQIYIHREIFTKDPAARAGVLGPGDARPQVEQPSKKSANEGVAEGKITLSTDPNWYGAEVGDYKSTEPVVSIPISKLVGFEPDDKMNQPKSKANVEKIVAGLKKGDKLPPILVRKYKNGYQVLDGHHRFWAYKLLGVKSIPAQIVPNSDIEEIGKQGVAEGITPDVIHKLADRKGVKWDDEPSFLRLTKRLTGKEHLDDLNQTELVKVKNHLENLDENFADGKHPGRKGLAKRSGVNTKASVSSLRNTAKHSTGEKARMSH
jgi:Domain of unknown function (DUF6321)/ParB-like nuclease domain